MTAGVLFNTACEQLLLMGCLIVWRDSNWAVYVVDTAIVTLYQNQISGTYQCYVCAPQVVHFKLKAIKIDYLMIIAPNMYEFNISAYYSHII